MQTDLKKHMIHTEQEVKTRLKSLITTENFLKITIKDVSKKFECCPKLVFIALIELSKEKFIKPIPNENEGFEKI